MKRIVCDGVSFSVAFACCLCRFALAAAFAVPFLACSVFLLRCLFLFAGCFAAAAFPPWPFPWPVSGASAGACAVGLRRLPPLFANTFGLSWLMLLLLSRWYMVLLLLLLVG